MVSANNPQNNVPKDPPLPPSTHDEQLGKAKRLGIAVMDRVARAMRALGRWWTSVIVALLGFASSSKLRIGRWFRKIHRLVDPASNTTVPERVFTVRRGLIVAVTSLVLLAIIGVGVWGAWGLVHTASQAATAARGSRILPDPSASQSGTSSSDAKHQAGDGSSSPSKGEAGADASATNSDAASSDDVPANVLNGDERSALFAQAQETAQQSGKEQVQYAYCVSTTGDVGDTASFEDMIFRTLNNPKGWPRAGATFTLADQSAGQACDMTITLAQAQYMTTFSDGCSDEYSCRVGNDVIINADRWNGATPSWIQGGGTLGRYRELVINHEVGHRLGHIDNETPCAGPGNPAPVMLQQSMGLDGCTPNEWPLDSELWIS